VKAAGILCIASSTGRFLLLRRSYEVDFGGTWSTPGGLIHRGEEPANAAVRELREETRYRGAIRVAPFAHPVGGVYWHFVGITPREFRSRLNWENTDVRWFRSPPTDLHPGCAEFFRDGFPEIAQAMTET
jgi:8-oxo-dGTP pyrophosphatase MutT (NUDIX family)